ncbi:EF-hand domain-containing protein [Stenotrophomonas sp.]|uniref:EF-hand domain-containing protein n=1 Tax=Stenotrophomonas sp. TaxID=69392 RepID=UPI0028A627A0|nr:EF-hand domain-containing protein [Stenotrophomonas sp.]
MKLFIQAALVGAISLASISIAQAQHAGHEHHAPAAKPATKAPQADASATFKRFDANNDGFISREELPSGHPLLPHFGMSDGNHDGKLDAKEFERGLSML